MNDNYDLVIVGLGPAGIAAALEASKKTGYKILCIDKGMPLDKRNGNKIHGNSCKCYERASCDVLSGFGGSSLISGTKLSGYPAGSGLVNILKDKTRVKGKIDSVMNYFIKELSLLKYDNKVDIQEAEKHYAKLDYSLKFYESLTYDEKKYRELLNKQYKLLLSKNIQIQFETSLLDISADEESYKITLLKDIYIIRAGKIILATGKSGYELLYKIGKSLNFNTRPSTLEVGVRLEFPAIIFNDIDKYQKDLKLKSGLCRTYCISKNGEVVVYNDKNNYFTEGRVRVNKITDNTNLAIVARIPSSNDNIDIHNKIINNYRQINEGDIILCNYSDFTTYIEKILPEELFIELKQEVSKFIQTFINQKDFDKIGIYLIERDFPIVTYEVKENFEILKDIYIVGAATGKFRGIIQSFASGKLCVEGILGDNEY